MEIFHAFAYMRPMSLKKCTVAGVGEVHLDCIEIFSSAVVFIYRVAAAFIDHARNFAVVVLKLSIPIEKSSGKISIAEPQHCD